MALGSGPKVTFACALTDLGLASAHLPSPAVSCILTLTHIPHDFRRHEIQFNDLL